MRQSPGSRRLVALFRRAAFALLVSTAAVSPGGELSPYTGEPTPPAAELKDAGGQPHSLSDYRGKLVLVKEAVRLLASVDTEGRSTEDIIRQALQNLAAR